MPGLAARETAPDGKAEPTATTPSGGLSERPSIPVANRFWQRDLGLIFILLLTAASIRAWLIWHTEVTARDSIGYIRYAWQLKQRPWKDVLARSESHPGYPLAILAVSEAIRPWISGPECVTMQLSAQ